MGDLLVPFPWKQGEHLAIVGDTGSGKSTLAAHLLTARRHRIIFRSKADDVTYDGARVIRTAAELDDPRFSAFVLDPRYADQADVFAEALDRVWRAGAWCVYLDELWYLARLGLTDRIERLLTQGRSKGVTVVTGMQRPVQVTRFALSQSAHVVSFGVEGRDVKTLIEATTPQIKAPIQNLDRFYFCWYARRERAYWIGTLSDLGGEP